MRVARAVVLAAEICVAAQETRAHAFTRRLSCRARRAYRVVDEQRGRVSESRAVRNIILMWESNAYERPVLKGSVQFMEVKFLTFA